MWILFDVLETDNVALMSDFNKQYRNRSVKKDGGKVFDFTSCGFPRASPSIFSIFLMMATF